SALSGGRLRVWGCGARPQGRPPADGAPAAVAIIGIRHLPLAAPKKRYIRRARRRKGASSLFLAAQESAPGAERTCSPRPPMSLSGAKRTCPNEGVKVCL